MGVVLLRPTSQYLHTTPIKMFEYMAAGLPLVVSDFPHLRRYVERHGAGIHVDPGDPDAVAQALSDLLQNPAEAAAMGQRGRQAVLDHYVWDTEADVLLALYGRVLRP